MHIEDIEYDADGGHMVGHLCYDDEIAGPRRSVLLCHGGAGLDDHVRGCAERLATLGYVAFALDYLGGGTTVPLDQLGPRLGPLMADPRLTRRLANAGLDVLLRHPVADPEKVAVTGYCFGGVMALELARSGADVKAVVGFHPGTPARDPDGDRLIRATVLMCCGTDDPYFTGEQRLDFELAMGAAGVRDWRMGLYGGVQHGFTAHHSGASGVPGVAYDEASDRRSWQAMLDVFDEVFGGEVRR